MEQERRQVMPWKVKELKRDQNGRKKKEEEEEEEERERNWRESWQRGEIGSWKTEVREDKTKMKERWKNRESNRGSGAIERGCACMRY